MEKPNFTSLTCMPSVSGEERSESLFLSYCTNVSPISDYPQYILVYPIAQGKIINVAGFHTRPGRENTSFAGPWIRRTERDELLNAYSRWEPEVQVLLEVNTMHFTCHVSTLIFFPPPHQCIEKPSQWAVHTSKPLNSYVSGRVVLLGDAVGYFFLHCEARLIGDYSSVR
jgi:salicylate hydroxylase